MAVVAVGALSMAQYDKAVSLSLDGATSSVHVFGSTVGDLLAKQDVPVGEHDIVQPAADAPLSDGDTVVVRYGRKLTVTQDGATTDYWTTATSVDGALAELGIRADSAKLSVSRSEPLGRSGLALTITTPKNVTVSVDGGSKTVASTGPTVADALQQLEVTLGAQDRVSPAPETPLTEGLAVTVNRVEKKSVNETKPVAFDGDQPGRRHPGQGHDEDDHQGRRRRADRHLRRGVGRREARVPHPDQRAGLQEPRRPGRRGRHQGRGARRGGSGSAPLPTTTAPRSGAGLNLANAAMWDKIAWCESGQRWNLDLGTGYYGGLQFLKQSWLSWHGDDFAPLPSLATREQQITVANRLYADLGLKPWTCKP